MPQSLAFFRGNIVPIEDARVSVMTHALHYGTAVFEGIRGNWNRGGRQAVRVPNGGALRPPAPGCRMMLMDIPYDTEELCGITIELLQAAAISRTCT